MGVSDKF